LVVRIRRFMLDPEPTFNILAGGQLSAITFVMDYIQFDFVTAKLTAYTLPAVTAAGRTWTHVDSGWRDALCERIGATVRSVICSEAALSVKFGDDSEIAISVRDADYVGPEAFVLSADSQPTVVG
jgi:hypothetical protein